MKHNWEYKNIEECLEKVAVTSKLQTKDFLLDGKYPIVSQEMDYISGYWNDDADVIHLTHPIVVFGDHSRVVKYIDFDFVVGADGVKILSPKEFLNPKFLYYFVKSADIPSLGYSRHYKLLREKDVPVPPLEEQSRIVAELDLLTGIIDKQNAQLKELDNLAQAIFYDMFGDPIENPKRWEVKKLGDVCDVRDGTHDSPDYVEDGYPLVTSKNVADGKISFENVNYINEADFISISKRSKVDDGDIIMPMIGTIGKPVIVSKTREFAIKNVALIKFYEDGSVMNVFIRSIISSDSFDAYMKTKNKGGTQKFIALGDIRKLNIPVPPLALQQSFAEKIQSIEKQKETIRASIADTQKLLDYTMDKYFG